LDTSKDINYILFRSKARKRTISIQVMADGRVVIRAPYRTSQREIDRFFIAKTEWVKKKLLERENSPRKDAGKPVAFISGEKFLYLGEFYPLEFHNIDGRKSPLCLYRGIFMLDENRAADARTLFIKWYKDEARRLLEDRVNYYSSSLELFPKGIRITSAQSRYGSCSPDNKLSFTWRLVMSPLDVIDYIIIHELMHIKEKNHSRRFWDLVKASVPDYKRHNLWLKEYGHFLRI
jgi:predicted metal-dependent hydrolase